jgi:hypothetical protein
VLYIVLDDVGFSAMEPFGGLIETPNINRMAEPAERSQSHDQQHGEYHRGGGRVPQLQRTHSLRVRRSNTPRTAGLGCVAQSWPMCQRVVGSRR